MYILQDGKETTKDAITAAYKAGKAVLVWSHRDGHNSCGLMLDGIERDTRGECYSMWDEVWTTGPKTLQEALDAALC